MDWGSQLGLGRSRSARGYGLWSLFARINMSSDGYARYFEGTYNNVHYLD